MKTLKIQLILTFIILLTTACSTKYDAEHQRTRDPNFKQRMKSLEKIAVVEIDGVGDQTLTRANMKLMQMGYRAVSRETISTLSAKLSKRGDETSKNVSVKIGKLADADAVIYGNLRDQRPDVLTLRLISVDDSVIIGVYRGKGPYVTDHDDYFNEKWKPAEQIMKGLDKLLVNGKYAPSNIGGMDDQEAIDEETEGDTDVDKPKTKETAPSDTPMRKTEPDTSGAPSDTPVESTSTETETIDEFQEQLESASDTQ